MDPFRNLNESEQFRLNNNETGEFDGKLTTTFLPIPLVVYALIALVILLLGLILNLTILRFYWNLKRSIAIYIRVFAIYDITVVLAFAIGRLVKYFASTDKVVHATVRLVSNFLAGFYVIGPLFLAIDRFLVVVSVLKFKDIERKLKYCKGGILFLCCVVNVVTVATILTSELDSGKAIRVSFTQKDGSFICKEIGRAHV